MNLKKMFSPAHLAVRAFIVYLCAGTIATGIFYSRNLHKVDDAIDQSKKDIFTLTDTPLKEGECLYIDTEETQKLYFLKPAGGLSRIFFRFIPDIINGKELEEEHLLAELTHIKKGYDSQITDHCKISREDAKQILSEEFRLISTGNTVATLKQDGNKGHFEIRIAEPLQQ